MNVTTPTTPFAGADALIGATPPDVGRLVSGRSFSAFFDRAANRGAPSPAPFAGGTTSPGDKGKEAYAAARDLVAITFVQPLFAEARQEPFQSELFHGGQGEKLFGARLDEILAERVTGSMRLPMVDAIYRRMMRLPAGGLDAHG